MTAPTLHHVHDPLCGWRYAVTLMGRPTTAVLAAGTIEQGAEFTPPRRKDHP